jgi:polysaccharide pyruvyl transferase WcaK-like protein
MSEDALERLAQALERICRQEGRYPLLMAFDKNEDVDLCRRLSERLRGGQVIVPTEERAVLSLFSEARCVISGRLHGLILARAAGATGIAMDDGGRDRKTVDFASRMGWDILDLSVGDTRSAPRA